jgi:hypothetical protein
MECDEEHAGPQVGRGKMSGSGCGGKIFRREINDVSFLRI